MHVNLAHDRSMLASAHASAREAMGGAARGPWLPLLSAVLKLAGPEVEFLRHAERPWSSATFSGSRHTIALAFTGDAAITAGENLIEALPEHEFTIPRQLVADAALGEVAHEAGPPARMTVELELLLLEDF
ncbi:hypothetical protein ACLIMP_10210 [Novosphingobium aerophilum]|uniref:hypothetical protein n=1 Tax=Novosphingobium TaxID=165696 RepID=UPI0017905FE6|nr:MULTISPECIES: hypothetical protein [unclassified Novosphingobium]WRT91526.1 hypothetical protein U9J33_09815 [Novosphingobium sp. RL4]